MAGQGIDSHAASQVACQTAAGVIKQNGNIFYGKTADQGGWGLLHSRWFGQTAAAVVELNGAIGIISSNK